MKLVTFTFMCFLAVSSQNSKNDEYLNEFVVEIDGGEEEADLVAKSFGYKVVSHLEALGDVFHFQHEDLSRRSKRSADDHVNLLLTDSRVQKVTQQKLLKRVKRTIVYDKQVELPIAYYKDKSVYERHYDTEAAKPGKIVSKDHIPDPDDSMYFKDPFYKDQWQLNNVGQTGGPRGMDCNVVPVWKRGYTGKGVVVSILDDGIDHTHPDLKQNYDAKASTDLNDRSDQHHDPMPNVADAGNSHGTRCAGEVAAEANNTVCGVGIAFNARIGGVRMLDGGVTDSLEAEALLFNQDYIDIKSASWGPSDDGKTCEGPSSYCAAALKKGAEKGRNGLGTLFIWATGNGGSMGDDCGCDGYVSSIYSLSIGCVDDEGESTYFTEHCPSTMAVIFTGGAHVNPADKRARNDEKNPDRPNLKIVTTDLKGECTLEFQGTSSAAPLAAGCFALVLEANPKLSWRDVQHIVTETARITSGEHGWIVNGAGKHVNDKFGFGTLDCGRMVEVAQNWESVAEQHVCQLTPLHPKKIIPSNGSVNITIDTDGCLSKKQNAVTKLEHVEIHVKIEHSRRGDLVLTLYSPFGTPSEVLSNRPLDDSSDNLVFTFMTVFNWGESPKGKWIFEVKDNPVQKGDKNVGMVLEVGLTLYGTGEKDNVQERVKTEEHDANTYEVKHIMIAEEKKSDDVQIRHGPEVQVNRKSIDQALESDVNDLAELLETLETRIERGFDDGGDQIVPPVPDNSKRVDLETKKRELEKVLELAEMLNRVADEHENSSSDKKYKGQDGSS